MCAHVCWGEEDKYRVRVKTTTQQIKTQSMLLLDTAGVDGPDAPGVEGVEVLPDICTELA